MCLRAVALRQLSFHVVRDQLLARKWLKGCAWGFFVDVDSKCVYCLPGGGSDWILLDRAYNNLPVGLLTVRVQFSPSKDPNVWPITTSFACDTTLLITHPLEHWLSILLSSSGRIGDLNLPEIATRRPALLFENTSGLRFGIREHFPAGRSAGESWREYA